MFEQDIMITLLDIILLGLKTINNLSVNHSARPCAVDVVLEAMHQVLRKKYPQFGQLHNGSFMQQVPLISLFVVLLAKIVYSFSALMLSAGELPRSDASPPYSPSNISVANGHIKSRHISFVDAFSTKGISSQQVKPVGLIGDASGVLSFVDAIIGRKEGDGVVQCAHDKPLNNVVPPDVAATGAKVEPQANEESASWSSSDKTEKSRNIFTRPLTAKLMS
ncbi:hypothetical protein Tco_0286541 [Tanacetum coccineum]